MIVLDLAALTGQCDPGSNAVPIAFDSPQVQPNPMILIAPLIANVVGRTVAVRDHNINVSVIVQIAESRSPAGPDLIENGSGTGRDIHKFLSGLFQQQWL